MSAKDDDKCRDPKCPATPRVGNHTPGIKVSGGGKPDAKCSGGKKP